MNAECDGSLGFLVRILSQDFNNLAKILQKMCQLFGNKKHSCERFSPKLDSVTCHGLRGAALFGMTEQLMETIMLISFAVENWMSFKERVEFSMVASREKQHSESVFAAKFAPKLLPVAAIYGGNASGKSNFCRALGFVQNFILTCSVIGRRISIVPFKLSKDTISKPSRFEITILIDNHIYRYGFALTNRKIFGEKLVRIVKRTRTFEEITLFERSAEDSDPHLWSGISDDIKSKLKVVYEGTRDNVLFLTNTVFLQIDTFKPVYDWFLNCLEVIEPTSRYMPFDQFLSEENPLYEAMNSLLPQFDTSIGSLQGEEIPFDSVQFPDPRLKQFIVEALKEGSPAKIRVPDGYVIFERDGDQIKTRKLIAMHHSQEGEEVRFEIKEESDGSQRMIDLLPAFLRLAANDSKKVYVIDEIDRSLHSLLTRSLIEMFISGCNKATQKQLIFTTHDILLMDQQLLRRDEMWITDRSDNSESQLISLCEYKGLRDDTDIQRRYLDGRLGGIPMILKSEIMNTLHTGVENTIEQGNCDE